MKRSIVLIFLVLTVVAASGQVKISDMPELTSEPTGGWIPLVLNGQNYKYGAGNYVQQKTIAQIRSSSPGTLPADFYYYVSDAGKQGFFKYANTDTNTPDDGATTILTQNNKRFKRVIEDNVVNSDWFMIGTNPSALINQLGLTFQQAKALFDRQKSRVELTDVVNGVPGDFTTQNATWFALQRAINYCINQQHSKLYIPAGQYNITKGLVVAAKGTPFVTSFEISGAVTAYGGDSQTQITVLNNSTFGIGFQRCKGIRVRNLKISGQNVITGTLYEMVEKPDMDWTHGCRTTRVSPHAGLIVDPFFSGGVHPAGDQYPGFETLYTDEIGFGGSTDVIFENCRVENFIVGYCFSPHTRPQNGDAMAVNNSWVQYCKSGISVGQSQNRSIYVNNLKCWGGVETLFDSYNYGDIMGDNPEVDGLQIAGGVRYLCRFSGYFNKGLIIKRMHAESLYSLGGTFGAINGDLVIEDSWINLVGSMPGTPAIHNPLSIFKGGNLKMTNTYLLRYNGLVNPPLQFEARNAVFEKCFLDQIPVNLTQNRVQFENCHGIGNFSFGDNEIIKGNYAPEIYNQKMLFTGNMAWQTKHGLYLAQSTGNYAYQRKQTGAENLINILVISGAFNLASVNQNTLQGTFTISPSSTAFKTLQINDPVYSYSSSVPNEFNDVRVFCLGMISAKDVNTGTVTIDKIAKGVDNTTSLTNLSIYRPHYLIPALYMGDATQGSNVITNCIGELNSPVSGIPVGVTITNPYFPRGTYIVSATSTTIVLSNEATATVPGIDIVGVDWKGEEFGYIDIYNRKCAYKKGDVTYNTDLVNYPTVERWVCSKTGITGTAYPPEFITYFVNINKTFSVDGTIDVDAGKLLSSLVVKSSVPLAAFRIGTTAGGSDILPSTAISAGSNTVLSPNVYLSVKTKLYFSGITGTGSTVEVLIPGK